MADDIASKINGLSKIAQFRFERWANRRQVEWKISAMIWAGLFAVSSGILLKNMSVPLYPLAVILVVVNALHIWWVYQNWIRNQEDIREAFNYFEEIHALSSLRPAPERKRTGRRYIVQDAVPTVSAAVTMLISGALLYWAYALQNIASCKT